jgi:hypothetical protein
MATKAPSYAAVEYWDDKYANDSDPFDWLLPAHSLRDALDSALKDCAKLEPPAQGGDSGGSAQTPVPECRILPLILHIGCGTSLLSFALKNLVGADAAGTVHNVDFSKEALQWGHEMEATMMRLESGARRRSGDVGSGTTVEGPAGNQAERLLDDNDHGMKWLQASLLSIDELVKAGCAPNSYSLVVDKSTADSIACGGDFEVRLPFPLFNPETIPPSGVLPKGLYVHPIHILSLNMAHLVIPGAIWLSFSYSEERFKFLDLDPLALRGEAEVEDDEALPSDLLAGGFPDPRVYWRLEKTVQVETAKEHRREGEDQVVHSPVALHYMYILRRTEVKLERRRMPFRNY